MNSVVVLLQRLKALNILPTPQLSTITYFSALRSEEALDFIQVGIGKLNFSAQESINPSVEQFSTFFNSNITPDYSFEADDGVEIVFRDGVGDVWKSYQDATAPQDFTFTSLSQESDELGDYMKFVAEFSLELYDDIDNPTDTITMENAVLECHFKL